MKLLSCITAICLSAAAPAFADLNLITNGNFETGNLAWWTPVTNSYGNTSQSCESPFAVGTEGTGCGISAPSNGTLAAYAAASFPAISNNTGEYTFYLQQTFAVPNVTLLSALLTGSEAATITGSGSFIGADVDMALFNGNTFLGNFNPLLTNPGPAGTYHIGWTAESADVTSLLNAQQGQSLTLYLRVVSFYDTRSGISSSNPAIDAGFDNIALTVTESAAPEPGTFLLGGGVLAIAGFLRRKRRG